jgi:hypothetical protein
MARHSSSTTYDFQKLIQHHNHRPFRIPADRKNDFRPPNLSQIFEKNLIGISDKPKYSTSSPLVLSAQPLELRGNAVSN